MQFVQTIKCRVQSCKPCLASKNRQNLRCAARCDRLSRRRNAQHPHDRPLAPALALNTLLKERIEEVVLPMRRRERRENLDERGQQLRRRCRRNLVPLILIEAGIKGRRFDEKGDRGSNVAEFCDARLEQLCNLRPPRPEIRGQITGERPPGPSLP